MVSTVSYEQHRYKYLKLSRISIAVYEKDTWARREHGAKPPVADAGEDATLLGWL